MNSNFKQIVSTKGGGTMSLDVPKDFNLEDLTTLLINKYFPDGENTTSGLLLADVDVSIATFTGKTIEQL